MFRNRLSPGVFLASFLSNPYLLPFVILPYLRGRKWDKKTVGVVSSKNGGGVKRGIPCYSSNSSTGFAAVVV